VIGVAVGLLGVGLGAVALLVTWIMSDDFGG
jgi:hypothetical protein